jgi:hypothetical protein
MKKRIIIYFVVSFVVIGILFLGMPNKPTWHPLYCNQYSDMPSYIEGGEDAFKCLEEGYTLL